MTTLNDFINFIIIYITIIFNFLVFTEDMNKFFAFKLAKPPKTLTEIFSILFQGYETLSWFSAKDPT